MNDMKYTYIFIMHCQLVIILLMHSHRITKQTLRWLIICWTNDHLMVIVDLKKEKKPLSIYLWLITQYTPNALPCNPQENIIVHYLLHSQLSITWNLVDNCILFIIHWIQKLMLLHLFTVLFRENFSSYVRINCIKTMRIDMR